MDAYCAWERVHVSGDMGGRSYCSSCDCITYSYFLISVLLFALGTVLSVFSFGAYDDTAFANLGHMWMVGPMCVCSAVMIAIRNVLYLRRRRILDTVVRQRIQDVQSQQRLTDTTQQQYSLPIRTVSEITLPPPYEQLVANVDGEGSDQPPPSYEEAIVGVSKEAAKTVEEKRKQR